MSRQYFSYIDTLTADVGSPSKQKFKGRLLLLRAVAYAALQNFDNAIDDLSTAMLMDSTITTIALWQRAVCQSKLNAFNASQGTNIDMKTANVLSDLSDALKHSPQNAYLYYNRGTLYAQRHDYVHALSDYSHALELDQNMGEAYYNRGLALILQNRIDEGVSNLSKAGELGIYTAYSVIKKYRKENR
jgi:tetratricopeptide (TPR) repeat protein